MKEQIYQNGFYAMLGMIVGVIITLSVFNSSYSGHTETQKDTIVVHDTVYQPKRVDKVSFKLEPYKPLSKAIVKKEIIKQGLSHPSIVLAQSQLETGNYTSNVCKKYNNLFGLRKGGKYRKYNHWTESVTAYKELIQSKYKGGNYYSFLQNLGYAEDEAYISKLKEMVQ